VILLRRARISDAAAIGAVHVAAWRSAYPGILPDEYLSRMSATRQARYYEATIASGAIVLVAAPESGGPRLVGFTTAGTGRRRSAMREQNEPWTRSGSEGGARPDQAPKQAEQLGDGEIETLYVLDDWREQGLGRRLMRAAAKELAGKGCRSAYVWVLRDNPSRFFYQHLGGQQVAHGATLVAGISLAQTAFSWDPIDRLLAAEPAG
jgi:ribosomal protein S18 acetylase RimI-like enzyme